MLKNSSGLSLLFKEKYSVTMSFSTYVECTTFCIKQWTLSRYSRFAKNTKMYREEFISCIFCSQKSAPIVTKWPNVSGTDTQDEAPI